MLFSRRTKLEDTAAKDPDFSQMMIDLSAKVNACGSLEDIFQIAQRTVKIFETIRRHSGRIQALKLNVYNLVMITSRAVGDRTEESIIPPMRNTVNEVKSIFSDAFRVAQKIAAQGAIKAFLNFRKDKASLAYLQQIVAEKSRTIELLELAEFAQDSINKPNICPGYQSQALVKESLRFAALPDMPRLYLGNEEFVEHGLSSILSPAKPIAISGPGGSGKTSLALAIAHHPKCSKVFGERRYLISCEGTFSTDHLLLLIARLIGLRESSGRQNLSAIMHDVVLNLRPTLLILDHLERDSNRDASGFLKFDDLLAYMGTLTSIRLIVTSRGEIDTIQTTMKLRALSVEAASSLFLAHHASAMPGDYTDFMRLAVQIDCYPLTVRLLAEYKKRLASASLVDEWLIARRQLFDENIARHDVPSSVMTAIALILSPAVIADVPGALELLGIISIFHHGLYGGTRRIQSMGLGITHVKENMAALTGLSLIGEDRCGRFSVPSPITSYLSGRLSLSKVDLLRAYFARLVAFYFSVYRLDSDPSPRLCFEITDIASFMGEQLNERPTVALARSTYVLTMLQYHIQPSVYPLLALIGSLSRIQWTQQLSACRIQLRALINAELRLLGKRQYLKGFTGLVPSTAQIDVVFSGRIEQELGQNRFRLSKPSVDRSMHTTNSIQSETPRDTNPDDICAQSLVAHASSVSSSSCARIETPDESQCKISHGELQTRRLYPSADEINCQPGHLGNAGPELSYAAYEDSYVPVDLDGRLNETDNDVPRKACMLSASLEITDAEISHESCHIIDLRPSELELFCTLDVYRRPGAHVWHNLLHIETAFADELLNELYNALYVTREDSNALSSDRQLGNILVRVAHAFNRFPSALLVNGIRVAHRDLSIAGGYADIFKGLLDSQQVALKRFRTFSCQEQDSIRKKFCREVILWRLLNHPHVLPFIGLDETTFAPRVCMVSPWMEQGNLIEYTLKAQPSIEQVNELLFQVADGLQYLHQQEIVHGDLRCANILINDRNEACLADFGLSALLAGGIIQTETNSLGSNRWNAPELFSSNSPRRTEQTDIYAFGCVCLEVHTRKCPFPEMIVEFAVVITLMRGGKPSRPKPGDSPSADMRDELWIMIEQCWDGVPERRPQLSEIKQTLSELGEQL